MAFLLIQSVYFIPYLHFEARFCWYLVKIQLDDLMHPAVCDYMRIVILALCAKRFQKNESVWITFILLSPFLRFSEFPCEFGFELENTY